MKSHVKVTSILSTIWVGKTAREIDMSVAEMATDIDRRAKMLAPRDSGALIASGRIDRIRSGMWRVVFGDSRVPYARIRHFENKRNPQTLGYLAKAGDGVARGNLKKYMRNR